MSFEFEEKSELSHTPQVENPVCVIRFPHCNKGNKMKPYRGLNVWLAFSLHPADVGSICQAAEWGPLPTRFPIPLLMFSSPSSWFLCPAMRFVTSHNPQDAKGWLFVNNTQPWSESSDSQTKALSWLSSTTANSLALNWQGKMQREREKEKDESWNNNSRPSALQRIIICSNSKQLWFWFIYIRRGRKSEQLSLHYTL